MSKQAAAKNPAKEDNGQRKLSGSRKERVTTLLEEIERSLKVSEMKVTLADFIRLTQLERELEGEEQPREIIVTWKDPSERRAGSK
jgi:hypothetical protein